MKNKKITKTIVAIGLSAAITLSASGQGADVVFSNGVNAMKKGEWADGLEHWTKFIESTKLENHKRRHGSKFGIFLYNQGICYDNLGQFAEAMQAFKTCNEVFPNEKVGKKGNPFEEYSLFKMAEAAVKIENYKVAVDGYEKFLAHHERGVKFPVLPSKIQLDKAHINLAFAHFKLGSLDEGLVYFKKALDNQEDFKLTTTDIYKAFDAFTTLAINEKQGKEVLKLLSKYRGKFMTDPYSNGQFIQGMIGKTQSVIKSDPDLAAQFISIIGHTDTVVDYLESDASNLDGLPETVPFKDGTRYIAKTNISKLKSTLDSVSSGDDPYEVYTLSQTSYLWSKNGNNAAAYGVFKELERNFSRSKNREENLFQLIKTANGIGLIGEANKYGKLFLEDFPESSKVGQVKRLMLIGLYYDRKYEECLTVAKDLLPSLDSGTEAHDMCLFVYAGSLYYTYEYGEARRKLVEHKTTYVESPYAVETHYLLGSTLSRLSMFDEAASTIDEFLEIYKESNTPFYPYAIFERANVAFSVKDTELALEKANLIEKEYSNSVIVPATYNLKGNIFEERGDLAGAEQYFKKALEEGIKKGDKAVASESLYFLINLISDNEVEERYAEAVGYYDEYWANYSEGSGYKADVAVKGHIPMVQQGREQESFEKMQAMIAQIAAEKGPNLEALITEYRDYYLEKNDLEALKKHFFAFPGIDENDREVLALLYISVVNAADDIRIKAEKEGNKEQVVAAEATIQTLFNELKNAFEPSTLTNQANLQVGDFIRKNTSTPIQGVAYYEEVIKREDIFNIKRAKFGIGDIYVRTNNPANHAKARTILGELAAPVSGEEKEGAKAKKARERAAFRLVELEVKLKDWDAVINASTDYIKDKFPKGQNYGYVTYYFALAQDKKGHTDTAFTAYTKAHFGNRTVVKIAAPSLKRMMEIQWQKNIPEKIEDEKLVLSSRQEAYNMGWTYVNGTQKHVDKMTAQEARLWRAVKDLVQEYENSKQIKDMATQNKERGIEN